jgi:RimJ/RimL family protein N-acetyltransferase
MLRLADDRDESVMRSYYSLPEVCRYQLWTSEQLQSTAIVPESFDPECPGSTLFLAIFFKDPPLVIGDCQLTIESTESRQGQLSFAVHPSFWGHGYATMAANATLGYAFTTLKLHRVFAATDVRNVRSWRLMERFRMRREACFRHEHFLDEEWVDAYVYAMLDQEWSYDA